jgi:hypothetical protein
MPPQNSLLCEWLMFSSFDPSLATGKIYLFRYCFTGSQGASCMNFEGQNCLFRVSEEGYCNEFKINK